MLFRSGHVYIVLEPVGSARLKFGDDRYYEFLCFDVPKVGQSPGYDHGHDEESRNDRDVKINILDDYVRTLDWFQKVLDTYRSTGGVTGTPPGVNGPTWALREKRRAGQGRPRAPSPLVRIGQGRGAAPPFLFPRSLFLFQQGKRGESYSRLE